MRRSRVFSALAALSGALLLLYGFDLGYPMAQFCFSASPVDSVIGREPIDCFAANPMWAFNPMLWILVDSGICVLVAAGAFLASVGLFRASSWARRAWLAVLAMMILYFLIFWVSPSWGFKIPGFVLSGFFACIFIASMRLLPRSVRK